MPQKTYSFDAAAALLNTGRNTLISRLRELGLIGQDNLPAGRERGGPHFRVRQRVFRHPTNGWTHYGRTEITERGMGYIALRLGAPFSFQPEEFPHPAPNHQAADRGQHRRKTSMPQQQPAASALPAATLHDAGELIVVTDQDRTHHRAALVLVFKSPSDLQRAIQAGHCAYQVSRDLHEERLHHEPRA